MQVSVNLVIWQKFTVLTANVVVIQSLSSVWLFAIAWTAGPASCPSLLPAVCLSSCLLIRWCHPTISSSVPSFSYCPQSFPASGSFPVSWLFTSAGQSIGASASASVLPNFLWDWLAWSLCSPRDSQESSLAPQRKSVYSSALTLLYGPTLTSIRDYWKNHSFDYMDLCQQNNVSAF